MWGISYVHLRAIMATTFGTQARPARASAAKELVPGGLAMPCPSSLVFKSYTYIHGHVQFP
jgi:hypothetical protein